MKRLSICAILLLLSGCASIPQIPIELQYAPPTGHTETIATIQGSQQDSALLDDFTSFVMSVDGKRVMAGRKGWSNALPVEPGVRNVTVAFQRGVFNAQADFDLHALNGAHYEVRFASDVQMYGSNSYCDFWIVDKATQKPVTEIRRGLIGGGGRAPVPIFIPIR